MAETWTDRRSVLPSAVMGTKDGRGKPPSPREFSPEASGRFPVAKRVDAKRGDTPAPSPVTRTDRPLGRRARSAVDCLERALAAKTPAARAKAAREGLVGVADVETQALLLRQLYLGELEGGHFDRAREVAEQLVVLGAMPDVARHDAARACQALGRLDEAITHLREAVKLAPDTRISFHLSTLGALLYAAGHADEARVPLEAAIATSGSAQPLVRGQLALAKHASGDETAELDVAYHELQHDRAGEGYGRFVLGELAFARGDRRAAQIYLEAFLAKVRRARPAARAALAPEVARAESTLGRIAWN
jgi:tetratricopeptide (TPR) repeat protein